MAVEHQKQQHRHVAEVAAHGAGLGVGAGVEEAGKVQAHLQADDFAGHFHRRKHDAHRQTDGHPDGNLLHHRREMPPGC
jgi:hypothetical protein